MKSKDIAIVGILLAVGVILRFFLALLDLPMTPNVIIAFYCLSIILIRPKIYEALGIGIVGAALSFLVSSSIFRPANFISEPIGALVCFAVYAVIQNRTVIAPGITTFLATVVSGVTFAVIALFAVTYGIVVTKATISGLVITFVPIIVVTAIVNAIIVQILFKPANRVLMRGPE
jgi:energy-coupling factor transport system ATP-binding protein